MDGRMACLVLGLGLAFGLTACGGEDDAIDPATDQQAEALRLRSCNPGSKRCSGNGVQTCGANGQWSSTTACPFSCSNGLCSGVCAPGARQCNGKQPQTCSTAGTWQNTGAACSFVCSAGVCSGV